MTTLPATLPMAPWPKPIARDWDFKMRTGTGQFIVSSRGTLLARVDRPSGILWLWDKKGSCEVTVHIRELLISNSAL